MIPPFSFGAPSRIVFGPGKLAELENTLLSFGSRPLLILGNTSFIITEGYVSLQKIFDKLAIPVKTINITTEPSPEMIDVVVADRQYSDIDMVISVGGGSTLDAGKAIAAMLVEGGGVSRFLEGIGTEKPSGKKLPFIAIPTTAGTGSEATSNAVLSSVGCSGFKKSLRHDGYFPNLALIDPLLTISCSKKLTISCSMDCFTQLVEGYLSIGSSPLTDALALDGIRAVSGSLRAVANDGDDVPARSNLSYGAMLSGIVLANAGLGTVHGFASAIGGLFAIPHGVICGSLMAPVNRMTVKNLRNTAPDQPALRKYAMLGRIVTNKTRQTDSWYQDRFIDELEELSIHLALPFLSDYDVTINDAKRIVTQTDNKNNPAKLSPEELEEILYKRIT
ncbi:MAG: iron-containing alcohol dehydrogenase [Proteobacteria bacterium]|nr:iron-containing alcohol dehydrogenase [Pseudomonadota bacterium]